MNAAARAIRCFLPRCPPFPAIAAAGMLARRATLVGGLGAAVGRVNCDLFGVGLPTADSAPQRRLDASFPLEGL